MERSFLKDLLSMFKMAGIIYPILLVVMVAYAAFIPGDSLVGGDLTVDNLITSGNVDGRDVSVDGAVVDSISTNGADDLTAGEVTQLQNINTETITNTQWSYLGASNQAIATTDNVTFGQITGPLQTVAQTNVTSLGVQTVFAVDDEITLLEISTPSNPAAGDNKLYFKSDDMLYILNSAGSEVQLATGGAVTTTLTEFTASGTYNVPTNVDHVLIICAGGGGGGGGGGASRNGTAAAGGGGGGEGAPIHTQLVAVTGGGSETVTIGTGGAGGAGGGATGANGGDGTDGVDTSFGATICQSGRGGRQGLGADSGLPRGAPPVGNGGMGGDVDAELGSLNGSAGGGTSYDVGGTGGVGGKVTADMAGGGGGGGASFGKGGNGGGGGGLAGVGAVGGASAGEGSGGGGGGGGGSSGSSYNGGAGSAGQDGKIIVMSWE